MSLAEALPALTVFVDGDQRCLFASRTFAKWSGVDPARIEGRPLREIIADARFGALAPHIATALTGREVREDVLLPGPAADLAEADYELRAKPRLAQGGKVIGAWLLLIDISDRKLAARRLIVKDTVTGILSEAQSLSDAAPRILLAVCDSLGCKAGALWHVDRGRLLRCANVYGASPALEERFRAECEQHAFARGVGVLGRIWQTAAPAVMPDISNDPLFVRRALAASEGLHTMFAFPILLGGEVLGIFEFFGSRLHDPWQSRMSMMSAIGSQVGQFIERRRAEENLRESEARLAALADCVPLLVWSATADGTVDFYGGRQAEYRGLRQTDEGIWEWNLVVHPDDLQATIDAWRTAVETGRRYEIEHRVEKAGGEFRWHISRAVPIRNSAGQVVRWFGSATDVHDLKSAESALRQSEARLRATFEGVADAIISLDASGRVLDVNPAFAAMHGFEDPEAAKRSLPWFVDEFETRLMDGIEVGLDDLPFSRVMRGENVRNLEMEARRRPTGELCFIGSYNALPVRDGEGNIAQVVVTINDITERRRTEERQRLLTREVDHRARNALAVVQAVVRMTKADTVEAFSAAVRGRVEALARSHTRLSENRWSDVDLQTLVRDELRAYDRGDEQRAAVDVPAMSVAAEAVQPLSMILHELATNAVKHGALSVQQGRVKVVGRLSAAGTLALTWTENGGPPVSPPERRGIGSTVIAGFAQQLGGSATLDWAPDGVRCSVSLPKSAIRGRRAGPEAAERRLRPEPRDPAASGSGRILVVEDDPFLAAELSDALREIGYEPIGPASTLDDALRAAATLSDLRAAVLDVNLGGKESWVVADVLAARGVPFLYATGYGESADPKRRGAAVIQKPYPAAELELLLRSIALN